MTCPPQPNNTPPKWTHITMIWDAKKQQWIVYANGVAAGQTSTISGWLSINWF